MFDPARRWREHAARPSYAGVATFLSKPYTEDPADLRGVDVALLGAAFDELTAGLPGARLGPRAIRNASSASGYDLKGSEARVVALAVVDYGDAAVIPGDAERSHDAIGRSVGEILDAGAMPIVLGGDHSVTQPALAACARMYGPLALLHVDAHPDTAPAVFGNERSHGTTMFRAVEGGDVRPDRYVQIGVRGHWPGPDELRWQTRQGITSVTARELRERGADAVLADAASIIGDHPTYLSVDIDAVDPAYAPATGTPEPDGISPGDLLDLARLAGERLNLVGADVVEVIGLPVDGVELTALVAERALRQLLAGIAVRRDALVEIGTRGPSA